MQIEMASAAYMTEFSSLCSPYGSEQNSAQTHPYCRRIYGSPTLCRRRRYTILGVPSGEVSKIAKCTLRSSRVDPKWTWHGFDCLHHPPNNIGSDCEPDEDGSALKLVSKAVHLGICGFRCALWSLMCVAEFDMRCGV